MSISPNLYTEIIKNNYLLGMRELNSIDWLCLFQFCSSFNSHL